jgi:hypothetical protein
MFLKIFLSVVSSILLWVWWTGWRDLWSSDYLLLSTGPAVKIELHRSRRPVHQTQSSMDEIADSEISKDIIALFRQGKFQSPLNYQQDNAWTLVEFSICRRFTNKQVDSVLLRFAAVIKKFDFPTHYWHVSMLSCKLKSLRLINLAFFANFCLRCYSFVQGKKRSAKNMRTVRDQYLCNPIDLWCTLIT